MGFLSDIVGERSIKHPTQEECMFVSVPYDNTKFDIFELLIHDRYNAHFPYDASCVEEAINAELEKQGIDYHFAYTEGRSWNIYACEGAECLTSKRIYTHRQAADAVEAISKDLYRALYVLNENHVKLTRGES